MNRNNQTFLRVFKVLLLPVLLSFGLVRLFVFSVQAQSSDSSAITPEIGSAAAIPVLPDLPLSDVSTQEQSELAVRMISQDENGLVLEFLARDYRIENSINEMGSCQMVYLPGFENFSEPGKPRLPVYGSWIGILPEADVTLEILESDQVAVEGSYDICPAPSLLIEPGSDPREEIPQYDTIPDPQVYGSAADFPAQPAELVSQGNMRSQRVAAVRFAPFQYNPPAGTLKYTSRLLLRVHFSSAAADQKYNTVDEGDYEDLLHSTLLNYDAARQWRTPPGDGLQTLANSLSTYEGFAPSSSSAYKVLVDHDAVYTLTYASLQTAGLPVDAIDPRTFRIENQGDEISIEVAGESDASFDPGDLILFYGQAPTSKWAIDNVYWLTWGGVNGLRILPRDGTPSSTLSVPTLFTDTLHMEKNLAYKPGYISGVEKDRWYWVNFQGSSSSSGVISKTVKTQFDLNDPSGELVNAGLRLRLYGFAGVPRHHTVITINQQTAADFTWTTNGSYEYFVNFPQSYLVDGTNYITVHVPVDGGIIYDYFWLDWFEIVFARQFKAVSDSLLFSSEPGDWEIRVQEFSTENLELLDISSPAHPVRISGADIQLETGGYTLRFDSTQPQAAQYYAFGPAARAAPKSIIADSPSDLHNSSNAADLIIISHADFISAIQPLAALRRTEGMRVVVVNVQDVYDEFSAGLIDPVAIRDFLAYAYASWQPPAPLYVLLVGDGHYDFKNYMATNVVNYIPPYLEDVDKFTLKETAADNRFVTFVGADFLPDMHLGRLPVRTAAQATSIVNKLLTYALPPSGDWVYKTSFVADTPDPAAGDFHDYSDMIADNDLPAIYWREKLYYQSGVNTRAAVHDALIAGINQGRLLVSYVGHGAIQHWNSLLWGNDNASLTNSGKYPFFVPMTCLEGYYIEPNGSLSALAESFLRASNRGSIGSFSATGLGLASGHDSLERGLFKAFFENHLAEFGPATTQAKLYMMAVTGNGYQDLVDTYVLLGDPTARLPLAILPDLGVSKQGMKYYLDPENFQVEYRFIYTNSGTALAAGVLLSDTLPDTLENPQIIASTDPVIQVSAAPLIFEIEDIPPGYTGVITLTADVIAGYSGPILNTAVITATSEKSWSTGDNRSTLLINPFIAIYLPIIAGSD